MQEIEETRVPSLGREYPLEEGMATSPVFSARIQLQQPRIQPEEMDSVSEWDSLSVFYGLPVYFKFKILFYTFTKTLGQRFDIFSFPLLDLSFP